MGIQYNPRIVTDGLVLALDAANPKSYLISSSVGYQNVTGVGDTPANVFDLNVNSFSQGGINAALTWTGNINLGTGKYYIIVQAWGLSNQGPISGVTLTVGGVSYTTDYTTLRSTNTDIVGQTIGQGGTVPGGSEQRRSNLTPLGSGALTSITLSATGGSFRNYFYAVVFVPSGVSDTNFANHVVVNSINSTTWTDLSGRSNTGTLTNGPTYSSANGGSIVFDGVDDFVNIGTQSLVGSGTSPFSVEVWFYNTKNWTSTQYTLFYTIKQDTEFFIALYNSSGTLYCWPTFRGQTQWGIPLTQSNYVNKWICLSVVYNGGGKSTASSFVTYSNGVQLPAGSVNFGAAGGATNTNSIASDGGSVFHQGNIASYKVYNRALTATEISQNFNALRSRFSI